MTIEQDLKPATLRNGGAGVTNESAGRWCVWQAEAPDGFCWSTAGRGTHAIRVEWLKGDAGYRDEAIADAIERIRHGVEPCDCEDCLDRIG